MNSYNIGKRNFSAAAVTNAFRQKPIVLRILTKPTTKIVSRKTYVVNIRKDIIWSKITET